MSIMRLRGACVFALVLLAACALAVQQPATRTFTSHAPTCAAASSASATPLETSSRRDAVRNAFILPLAAAAFPGVASAAKFAPGSKGEKLFNDCLSLCAYYCMKPKGQFTKTRTECLLECKPICKADPDSKFVG
ncbi:hypothetical protein T492DRAFT_1032956 [Pavlovales sp. CCMP2436]|nr:hypothetical protein T492DRAFT_1032956 [Pavlovales sp. CCMP2436]